MNLEGIWLSEGYGWNELWKDMIGIIVEKLNE